MKTIVSVSILTLGLFSLSTTHFVLGANNANLPDGIEQKNWLALGDRLGFVVVPSRVGQPGTSESSQSVKGYLVTKTAKGWQRLDLVDPAKFIFQ